MPKGRPLAPLSVTVEEHAQLVAWSKTPKTAQAPAMRSREVLLAAEGRSNTEISRQLSVTLHTFGKWRQRYLDNYGTHKTALIRTWLAKRPCFHLHFTPTSASWLKLVERWFAALTGKQLRRGVHRFIKELETAIRTFIQKHNQDPMPFVWHKTADQILDSVALFCVRTLETGR